MRALVPLLLLVAVTGAAELTVDNAMPARFGARFVTMDGMRLALFNGENGIELPVSVEDPCETEVVAVLRADRGRAFRLRVNLGTRSVEASGVGTGAFQELSLGRLGIPAGLSRLSAHAPDSGSARIQLRALRLAGAIGAVSPPVLPVATAYIDEGKGRHVGWKGLELAPDGEARIPLFGQDGSQSRRLVLRVRPSGPARLTLVGAGEPVVLDLGASPATLTTPPITFVSGTQLLRIKASGAAIRIDEIALADGTVSRLWPLPNGNAQSVHFAYSIPDNVRAQWAYIEALGEPGVPTTYNCSLGFDQGYLGYQVRRPGEAARDRLFIFSVWDGGYVRNHEKAAAGDSLRDKVVTLIAKGEGVVANAFDHEGSGGHSHLDFAWKDRQPYRFLLGAKPDGSAAIFSAYVDGPGLDGWRLLASFRRPGTPARIDGLYSFVEDWSGRCGDRQRACRYRNLWVCGSDGKWLPLLSARTSATEELGRRDFSHRVVDGAFELRTGGYDRADGAEGRSLSVTGWGEPPKVDLEALPGG